MQSFLPWILYFVLVGPTQHQLDFAICAATFTALAFEIRSLKKGYILSWGTLIFFCFLLISVVIFRNAFIVKHAWVLSNGTLAFIAWFSILINRPFTCQYAREQVPSEHWHSPLFLKINYLLSAVWGCLFLLTLGLNILHITVANVSGWAYEISTYLPSIAGAWITGWFPDWYKRKVDKKS